mgnify:CR=1 FL=1
MTRKQIISRWDTTKGKKIKEDIINELSKRNGHIAKNIEGLGEIDGRCDIRGLSLPGPRKLRGVSFESVDMSFANLSNWWIEGCYLDNVYFGSVKADNWADHGNHFKNVKWVGSDLTCGGFGYKGSKYQNCVFERCSFGKSVFIRPEYDDCLFLNCMLRDIDFNGASFVRCKFVGMLKDVWFRGSFAYDSDFETFGMPRKNKMIQVDFSDAQFDGVTFSNGCDLSTVTPPNDPWIYKFDKWPVFLRAIDKHLSLHFSGEALEEARIFVDSLKVHADDQEQYLLNLRDAGEILGEDFAKRFKEVALSWQGQLFTKDIVNAPYLRVK